MDMLLFSVLGFLTDICQGLNFKFVDPAEIVEKLHKYSHWTDTQDLSAPENICVYMKECCHWNTSSYLLLHICKVTEFLLDFPIARCNFGLCWFLSNLI